MKFNENLQALRKNSGISQEQLADRLNVSRQAVSKWENGSSYPETEKLIVLSEMFGVTVDSMLKSAEPEPHRLDETQEQAYYDHPRFSYEYKSNLKLFGLPLVHIHIGRGLKKAKGVLAIGNIATGVFSVGMASMGVFSIGIASIGLVSLGCAAFGLLALGALAVGVVAMGSIAVGIFAFGAVSIGLFSFGACAIARFVAVGDYANAQIAIGEVAIGLKTIEVAESNRIFGTIRSQEISQLIRTTFPDMWAWLVNLISGFFHG